MTRLLSAALLALSISAAHAEGGGGARHMPHAIQAGGIQWEMPAFGTTDLHMGAAYTCRAYSDALKCETALAPAIYMSPLAAAIVALLLIVGVLGIAYASWPDHHA